MLLAAEPLIARSCEVAAALSADASAEEEPVPEKQCLY
jgi:hypothetical protein